MIKNIKLKDRIYQMFLNRPNSIIDKWEFSIMLKALSLTTSEAYVYKILYELEKEEKIQSITNKYQWKYRLNVENINVRNCMRYGKEHVDF